MKQSGIYKINSIKITAKQNTTYFNGIYAIEN